MIEILISILISFQAKYKSGVFVGERAFNFLQKLNDAGSKETSSYNCEILTRDLFKKELQWIQQDAHKNQVVDWFVQKASGPTAINRSVRKEFRNLQNVVAILKGEDESHFIILNCHYDSTPGSPGASDDLMNCAVMSEILRVLSQQEERQKMSIIFLFNNGEERGLLGSQGFLRHFKGAENISALINLESTGSGGREML